MVSLSIQALEFAHALAELGRLRIDQGAAHARQPDQLHHLEASHGIIMTQA